MAGKTIRSLLLAASFLLVAIPAFGQCGAPSFSAGVNVEVGMRPFDIASGDFNGDGKTDLVISSSQSNSIFLLSGSSTGVPTVTNVNFVPGHIAVADFNHDGKLDLAVTHGTFSTTFIAVLLGDGTGAFSQASDTQIQSAERLLAADFNNDGNPDLFLGNSSTNTTQVLLGNGVGGFGSPISVVVGNNTQAAAGDFNNDGKPDLVLVNGFVSIALGDGAGHFTVTSSFTGSARYAGVADFNGDGKLDVVTAGQSDGVSVLLGNGAGSILTAKSVSTGFSAAAVAVGDFNGDGKPDIAAVGHSTVAIIPGDGNGGFGSATNYVLNQSPIGVAVGDLDGDGKLDVATANVPPDGSFPNLNGSTNDTATILLGDGTGKLRYASVLTTNGNPFAVATGDLNGDGKPDLVTANITDNNVSVLLGDGAGGFGAPSTFAVGTQPRSVALTDLNGDGKPDLVTANTSANTVSILPGDGAGGFGAPTQLSVPGFSPDYVAIGDFNNDGAPDLAVAYGNSGSVSVMLGNGAGGFGPATNFAVPSGGQQVVVNDFNDDGKADLVVATISGVAVLLGDGNGRFGAVNTLQTTATASSVAVGDFNGDGKADLITAVSNNNVVLVYLGDGQGGFATPLSFRAGVLPVSLALADYNGDGNADVAAANSIGTISVLLGDGAGGFSSPVSYVTPGPVPRMITSADFNSDGRPDLAVANQGGNVVPTSNPPPGNVSVLFNRCSAAPLAVPALSVGDVSITEGDSGTTSATFNVTLSAASSKTVAVSFYTAGQDAIKDVDYKSTLGRLSFAPGVTSQTVTVPVIGDTLDEFDESFLVILAHPLGANVNKGQGRGTILDDDPPPSASIDDVTLNEGNAGTKQATFTVSLSAPSGKPISISFATADGSANSGTDYQASVGTLTFNPGQTSRTLSVPINGDTTVEPDETFFVNLTGPVNVTLTRAQGVGTIVNDDTSVQFSAGALQVNEAAGVIQVTVTRLGLLSVSSSVNYSTSDGTASEKSDYNLVLGTLRFAPGETSKVITVFITDDSLVENSETFNIALSGSVGCTLGSPSAAVVTINSDDTANGMNPVDGSQLYVRQHYRDFLSRDPDASGFAFWTNEIEQCGADAQCREVKRINVSAAFFLSIEFQETGYLVERMYKTSYGDAVGTIPDGQGGMKQISVPVVRLREFLSDTQEIASRPAQVVVGQGNWQQQLEDNKNTFAMEFVQRQRFTGAFPLTMTPAQFVDKLISNAGISVAQATRDQLIAQLAAASDVAAGRASVLRQVAENPLLQQAEVNRAFVLMQYYGYLRRNPDDSPDADFRGWDFWLTKLNQFSGNFVSAEMVKAFISSIEYRQRFGQP
ncbi:MAG: hypothetical protein QOC99_1254 [Acidobacteriota bacterium]|jgi:hypothetical protein|nr:hypothetical protein [Acidobacteriota bacterium]